MKNHRWGALGLLACSIVFLLWGVFVLGFLAEPSAVGRMRVALAVIGAGSIVLAAGLAVVGLRMLVARRT